MEGRCGPLCQHPGCWHFGEKHVAHMKKHKGYMQYLDYIISNKKGSKIKERLSNDGLPILTISDVTHTASLRPYRSVSPDSPPLRSRHRSLPPLKQLPKDDQETSICNHLLTGRNLNHYIGPQEEVECKPFSFTQCLFEQQTLNQTLPFTHGEGSHPPPPTEEYTFTPVLLWKPGPRSRFGIEMDKDEEKKGGDKVMKITDLTNSLPPEKPHYNKQDKKIRSRSTRGCRSERFTMDQYIMEGLSDMPPHIVHQIIQHLHSQSDIDVIPAQDPNESNDTTNVDKQPPPTPPAPSPTPPPSLNKLHHIPSSLVFDVHSKKVHLTSTKQRNYLPKKSAKSVPVDSFSRALAAKPHEALSGLKIKMGELQQKANQTPHQDTHQKQSQSQTNSSTFPGIESLKPPTTIVSGPSSYFAPRTLTKATLHRLNYRQHAIDESDLKNQSSRLNLSLFSTLAFDNKKLSMAQVLPPIPRLSIHVPVSPFDERPFSEDVSLIRPQTETQSQTRPDSRAGLHSGIALSHISSDHLITSADLASQTGKLLLLNRDGEVVHQIERTETDLSLPLESILQTHSDEEGEMNLDEGTIAPPPTARHFEIDDKEKTDFSNMLTTDDRTDDTSCISALK